MDSLLEGPAAVPASTLECKTWIKNKENVVDKKVFTSMRLSALLKGFIKEHGDLRLFLRIPFLIMLRE